MKIGYARSEESDGLIQQAELLSKHGCEKIYSDLIGKKGMYGGTHELMEAIRFIRPGDELVVLRLDYVTKYLPFLLNIICRIGEQGGKFSSIYEKMSVDTDIINKYFILLAEYHKFCLLSKNKRLPGFTHGRPRKLDKDKIQELLNLYADKNKTWSEIADHFGLGTSSIGRYLKNHYKKTKQ